jgi:hypothetical protein
MRDTLFALATLMVVAAPASALADDSSAVTGAAGGAVAGAIVGGPVGAVVGGVAGAAVGGAANPAPVVVAPGPCATRTTTVTNNNTGASRTTQTTDCH